MTDYKKYALGQVENFLYDAMSAEASPQEIYDTIRNVVQDNLNVYTKSADQARQLLNLLNGVKTLDLNLEDLVNLQYTDEELNAMCDKAASDQLFPKKDKVTKWIIPVDDDYNITFPEDLLEQTGWKEGDTLQWIDQGDGSYIMKKVILNPWYAEALAEGYTPDQLEPVNQVERVDNYDETYTLRHKTMENTPIKKSN